jgi:ABC-type multidrug transport system fused ATPase/permease subunit
MFTSEWRWIQQKIKPFFYPQMLSMLLLLVASVLASLDPLIMRWIIDHGLHDRHWGLILAALSILLLLFACRAVLLYAGNMQSATVLQRASFRIRLGLFEKLQSLDARFHATHPAGDLISRLEQDVELVGAIGVDLVPALIRIAATALIFLVIMIVLDWRLTCFVLPFVPLFIFVRNHFRSLLYRSADSTRRSVGERCSFLNEWMAGILQIQLLKAGSVFRRRYGRVAVSSIRAGLAQTRVEMLYTVATQAILVVVTAAVLGGGVLEVFRGALTVGGYVAFYSYLLRLFDPLSAATETYGRLKRTGASVRRLIEIEAAQSSIQDSGPPQRRALPSPYELACRDVGFAYNPKLSILYGISFAVCRGEKLAIVGRSGSGKSTLAHLLVRLYEPSFGEIRLNGQNVSHLALDDLRSQVSLVSQVPILFAGSLRDNVHLGKPSASEDDLRETARITCFDAVVNKFPAGWDHVLGPAGIGLSDGEKQRLGLMRALLQNRPILILDEATSALDPMVETALLERIAPYVKDKIMILITHRLSTACWADRILVFHRGRIIRECRPSELEEYGSRIQEELWSVGLEETETAHATIAR